MTRDGQSYKWCHQCRKWRTGSGAHYTREHRFNRSNGDSDGSSGGGNGGGSSGGGNDNSGSGSAAGGLASMPMAGDDDAPFDSNLCMLGGYCGMIGGPGIPPGITIRPKDWKACKCCDANVRKDSHCEGTIRHQRGRVTAFLNDGRARAQGLFSDGIHFL